MMKSLVAVSIFAVFSLSACSSTSTDKRLDDNFVFQCAVKLINDAERKVSGEDAERICEAARREELTKTGAVPPPPLPPLPVEGPPPPPPAASPAPSVSPTASPAAPAATPAETHTTIEDHDEVKPEPTPEKK